jgi:hypothetical protein
MRSDVTSHDLRMIFSAHSPTGGWEFAVDLICHPCVSSGIWNNVALNSNDIRTKKDKILDYHTEQGTQHE